MGIHLASWKNPGWWNIIILELKFTQCSSIQFYSLPSVLGRSFFIWLLLGIAQLAWTIVQIQGVNTFLARLSLPWGSYACSGWVWCKPLVTYLTSPKGNPIQNKNIHPCKRAWLAGFLTMCWTGCFIFIAMLIHCYYLFTGTYSFTGSYEAFIVFSFWGGGIGWLVMILGSLGHVLLWIQLHVWKVDAVFLYHGVLVAGCLIG